MCPQPEFRLLLYVLLQDSGIGACDLALAGLLRVGGQYAQVHIIIASAHTPYV
jgi:hypothetical protein